MCIRDRDYIGYYLGVPGVYNEREQMLASMFGFEEFRLMKGQETRDGSFGSVSYTHLTGTIAGSAHSLDSGPVEIFT